MRKTGKVSIVLIAVIFLSSMAVFQPAPVKAQAKTIVVPDDYQTITSAIGNATNGDTILVRSGTYEGPINDTISITKSISIIGENTENTFIKLHPAYSVTWNMYWPTYDYSDAITITADSCFLQNLTIQITDAKGDITARGNQILFSGNKITSLNDLIIKGSNCRITNNELDGDIVVEGTYNQVDKNTANFIQVSGSYNFIKNNNCKSLNVGFSSNNVFLENNVSNELGDWGVSLHSSNNNYFYKNIFSGFLWGFTLRYSSNNVFKANTVTDCLYTSINFYASDNNLFSLNNFADNAHEDVAFVCDSYNDIPTRESNPNLILSTNIWSENDLGNYWDNYKTKYPDATAIDNTQVGSIPYAINENNIDPYPLMSSYDVSSATIQLPDWATNLNVPTVAVAPTFPSFHPSVTPTQTSSISPTLTASPSPSSTITPNPPTNTNLFQLELIDYLLLISVIVAIGFGLSVLLFRRHRKIVS